MERPLCCSFPFSASAGRRQDSVAKKFRRHTEAEESPLTGTSKEKLY